MNKNQNVTFFQKAGSGSVKLSDIFSDVLRRHTPEENARVFLAGTPMTTPSEATMLSQWLKPYLFARILLIGGAVFAMGIFLVFWLQTVVAMPFVFTLGSFLVPVAVLFFFWEMNIPRNLSFANVMFIFFAGGMLSLVFTGILNSFDFAVQAAFMIGVIEESTKVLAASFWLAKGDKKYILTGMLVGAAVGAGFAAIESTGYAILVTDWSIGTLLLRALLAPAGHVSWAAISCGALVWAKGSEQLKPGHFVKPVFLAAFCFCVITHACWDVGIFALTILMAVLIVCAAFWLLKKGLEQITEASLCAAAVRPHVPMRQDMPVAAPLQPDMLRIQGMAGAYAGRRFALQGRIRIGRDPKRNDLVFPPNAAGVSACHCEVMISGSRVYIRDLGSSYGTYVNQSRLQKGRSCEVRLGDRIYLGSRGEEFQIVAKRG